MAFVTCLAREKTSQHDFKNQFFGIENSYCETIFNENGAFMGVLEDQDFSILVEIGNLFSIKLTIYAQANSLFQ